MNRYKIHSKPSVKPYFLEGDRVVAYHAETNTHVTGSYIGPSTTYKGWYAIKLDPEFENWAAPVTKTSSFSYPIEALRHE